ncbi:unnamed protein product [Amaranthus hypochondriacus]
MRRRCSNCSEIGHNCRTCPTLNNAAATNSSAHSNGSGTNNAVTFFGPTQTNGPFIKKSASMGNISHYHSNLSSSSSDLRVDGCLSDDPNNLKGKAWSEEEHLKFLVGLRKYGKGDWKRISREYVVSRTPMQVASHAQKFFIRQKNITRQMRRPSVFDMVPNMVYDRPETEPMEALFTGEFKQNDEAQEPPTSITPANLTYVFPTYLQFFSHEATHPQEDNKGENSHYPQVLKPTPVRTERVNLEELLGMPLLPPQLSLNPLGDPSRKSAFHDFHRVCVPVTVSNSDLIEAKNSPIQAVRLI